MRYWEAWKDDITFLEGGTTGQYSTNALLASFNGFEGKKSFHQDYEMNYF